MKRERASTIQRVSPTGVRDWNIRRARARAEPELRAGGYVISRDCRALRSGRNDGGGRYDLRPLPSVMTPPRARPAPVKRFVRLAAGGVRVDLRCKSTTVLTAGGPSSPPVLLAAYAPHKQLQPLGGGDGNGGDALSTTAIIGGDNRCPSTTSTTTTTNSRRSSNDESLNGGGTSEAAENGNDCVLRCAETSSTTPLRNATAVVLEAVSRPPRIF